MARPLGEATREAYGKTLAELGRENPNIVVLDGDLSKSTMTKYFAQEFPDRFFNVGIAEANMVGIAAGLASAGKIAFASSFACFVMCKAFDQMRLAVAYSRNNVKIVGSHGGISIGEDGVSQMGHEDIGLALSLPGFVVMVPADGAETRAAVRAAVEHVGPVYIRVGRPKAPIIYENGCPDFQIGKAITLREGRDVTLIANGLMVAAALDAADALARNNPQKRGWNRRRPNRRPNNPRRPHAVDGLPPAGEANLLWRIPKPLWNLLLGRCTPSPKRRWGRRF